MSRHFASCAGLFAVLLVTILVAIPPAEAGLLSKLGRLADDAGDAGRSAGRIGDSDIPSTALRAAKDPNTTPLALSVADDGSIRLTDELGRAVDIPPDGNLDAVLRTASNNARKVAVLTDAKTLGMAGGIARQLAKRGALKFWTGSKALPMRIAGDRLAAEVRPGIALPLLHRTPRRTANGQTFRSVRTGALREVTYALDKPLNRGTVIVAQIGKPPKGPRRVGFGDGPTGRPGETLTVPEDELISGFSGNRGGTVILAGRVRGDTLLTKAGPLDLAEFRTAAAAADVHLMVVDGPAKAAHKALAEADTYGDLLAGLPTSKTGKVIDAEVTGSSRVRLIMAPDKPKEAVPTVADDALTIGSTAAEVVVRASFHGVTLDTRDRSEEQDRQLRLIPGVPFWVHLIYALNLIFGLYGGATAWRAWRRIWPMAPRPRRTAPSHVPRFLVFLLVFLPLTGIIWAVVAFFAGIWSFIMAALRLIGIVPRRPA
ncbi:MAG: hypothetical protein AAGH68_04420 [Pseudomonadota bacterium]